MGNAMPGTSGLAIANGVNGANMLDNYLDVANNGNSANDSLGHYDPNNASLEDAYNTINKNYANYVTSPVAPALNAASQVEFKPQLMGLEALREAGGKAGQAGGQGIMAGIQGLASGLQAGMSGGTAGTGGMGVAGAQGMNPIDIGKYKMSIEQELDANNKAIENDAVIAPDNDILRSYNVLKGLKAQMNEHPESITAQQIGAATNAIVQMERPKARITDDNGNLLPNAGDIVASIPILSYFSGAIKKLTSGTSLPPAAEINGMFDVGRSLAQSAADNKNARIEELEKQFQGTMTRPDFNAHKINTKMDDTIFTPFDDKAIKTAQQANADAQAKTNLITGVGLKGENAVTPNKDGKTVTYSGKVYDKNTGNEVVK
jgi:hypothetical protein